MTNHTPAPWFDSDAGDIVSRSSSSTVLEGGCVYNDADRDLILAAPDMYEALRNIHGLLKALGKDHTAIYAMASDALKKARGGV